MISDFERKPVVVKEKGLVMSKIHIISNISSKTHAGLPFCLLDYKKCKIENDLLYGENI